MDTSEPNITEFIFNELQQTTSLIKDIAEIVLSYINEPLIKGEFVFEIGSREDVECEFHQPFSIRTDGKCLYTCDFSYGRIQKIDIKNRDKDENHFEFTQINVATSGCTKPFDIAIYEPYMYVTSAGKFVVYIFETSTGKFMREIYCNKETCDFKIYIYNSLLYTCFCPYQINVYTLEGNFVKEIKPENIYILGYELICTSLFVADDDIYIRCCDNDGNNNNVVCLTIEGEYKFHLNEGMNGYESIYATDHLVYVTDHSVYVGGHKEILQYNRYGKFIRKIQSDHIQRSNGIAFIGNKCFVTDMHRICVFK